jgi:hypothetical protein
MEQSHDGHVPGADSQAPKDEQHPHTTFTLVLVAVAAILVLILLGATLRSVGERKEVMDDITLEPTQGNQSELDAPREFGEAEQRMLQEQTMLVSMVPETFTGTIEQISDEHLVVSYATDIEVEEVDDAGNKNQVRRGTVLFVQLDTAHDKVQHSGLIKELVQGDIVEVTIEPIDVTRDDFDPVFPKATLLNITRGTSL